MNKYRWILCLLGVLLTSAAFSAGNMKAFVPAEKGMVRYVLELPTEADESAFKVELIVGKTVKTDAANHYFFVGTLEAENISGWGFTQYRLNKIGPMAGTLMAADPRQPQVQRFIALGGEPYLIGYNSQLPVVVYVPKGVEVRYRIWRADVDVKSMKKD